MQSVPITTKVVSSNHAHEKVYLIQHYVIKFCQWLATGRQGRWFSPSTPVSSTNKTDRHDITEILLKVALNTINLPFKTGFTTLNFCLFSDGPFCFCSNSNNNTYWCLRTINSTHDLLYCEFINNFISYYDLTKDPFQVCTVKYYRNKLKCYYR
jgi:hypothetical protein